jgi:hypothetical protein
MKTHFFCAYVVLWKWRAIVPSGICTWCLQMVFVTGKLVGPLLAAKNPLRSFPTCYLRVPQVHWRWVKFATFGDSSKCIGVSSIDPAGAIWRLRRILRCAKKLVLLIKEKNWGHYHIFPMHNEKKKCYRIQNVVSLFCLSNKVLT